MFQYEKNEQHGHPAEALSNLTVSIRNPYFTPGCPTTNGVYPVRAQRVTQQQTISNADIVRNEAVNNRTQKFRALRKKVESRRRKTVRAKKTCPVFDNFEAQTADVPLDADAPFDENDSDIFTDSANIMERLSILLDDISKYAGLKISDEVIVEIEGIAALIVTLQGCRDYVSAASAIFLYVRKFFTTSVTRQVMSYIRELFEFEPQSGDPIASEDWLDMMKNARDNWTRVRENSMFAHFSKLLGLIVTLGMCKASDVTFSIKEQKIWEPDMKVVHGTAIDIVDAALQTVVFFVEHISLCYRDKSLKPLLNGSSAAAELDQEYATVVLWWDLVKNGNLQKVAGVSDNEFDNRVEKLCSKLKFMMNTKLSFEKKLIQDKYMRLLRIKNDFITMKLSSGVRKAPFVIEFFGASSQGKTTCGDQIVDAILTSLDLPTALEYRATHNAADDYMSTWTSDKLVLTIDDMANDKSSFVKKPPTRVIVDVCNNQPFYANMADLESKGKVFVEPALVVVSTNVKDLDARTYSNCPYSIQRRMHAVVTVKAKEEFQFVVDGRPQGLDSAKVAAFYEETGTNPVFDDIWELTVEKAVQPEKLHHSAGYAPVSYRGKKLVNAPLRLVMQYLIEESARHDMAQRGILDRMRSRSEKIHKCPHEGCKQMKGYCDLHDHLETQFGEKIVDSLSNGADLIANRVRRDIFGLDTAIEGACTLAIMSAARRFARHWDWISMIPTPWLRNANVKKVLMFADQDRLKRNYMIRSSVLWGSVSLAMFGARKQSRNVFCALGLGLGVLGVTAQKSMVQIVKSNFERELVDRNTIAPAIQSLRDRHVGNVCKAFGIIGSLYALSKVYRSWRAMRAQGSLEPKTQQEIEQRDSEVNVWTSVSAKSLPLQVGTQNTTSEQLKGLVSKNLVYGSVDIGSSKYMVNGLFLRSNIVLVPDHFFTEDVLNVTFRKQNPDDSGGKFAVRLSKLQSVKVPDTDLRICYSSNGGSFKDLVRYFPNETVPEHEFDLLWRSREGVLTTASGLARPQRVSNSICEFAGHRYNTLTINTFKGLCGATLISRRRALITGIHLGGKTDTPKGCSGQLVSDQIYDAIEQIRKFEGVLLTGTAEKFDTQILGVTVLNKRPLHPKSPLNFMPENSQVDYYGSCPGMSTFVSRVKPTLISEHVTDVTGCPNIYGPPIQHPQWVGWQNCLANLAVPALPFEPDLLTHAVRDYKEEMLPLFKSELWNSACPLTDQENLCGIPGVKFIDAINLSTSIGYPLSGPKRNFIIEHEPTPERPVNRTLDPVIMQEIQRCEDCYLRGERAYSIAKACKKDEIHSKPKCRIFYGNSIAMTWLVRKYFLPIVRVMQMNPLLSECAVGINSHGPEWEELHQHIFTHGKERLIGGDYGKYDQKLPSQLLLASMRIMIDFARECDYSETDLRVMEAMAGDIIYAIIAFNGDLIGLTEGTHISGNSITVILNGISGSLNLRCCFYRQYPFDKFELRMKFREWVKLVTYGDDNAGSVRKGADKFTITNISAFLAGYGQIYTMPDKESELLDYLPPEEFEFLKRKSVYHPELQGHVGALIDKSCIKMLHCYVREKNAPVTEEHACGLNIDTALREWFNHGESTYEMRRTQMTEIAKRSGISHLCTELDVTYADRVQNWKSKYIGSGYQMYTEPDSFEC